MHITLAARSRSSWMLGGRKWDTQLGSLQDSPSVSFGKDDFEDRYHPRHFVRRGHEQLVTTAEELNPFRRRVDRREIAHDGCRRVTDIDQRDCVGALETNRNQGHATLVREVENLGFRTVAVTTIARIDPDRRCRVVELRAGIAEQHTGAGIERAHSAPATGSTGSRSIPGVTLVGRHEESSGLIEGNTIGFAVCR